jgi:hypothetical protein
MRLMAWGSEAVLLPPIPTHHLASFLCDVNVVGFFCSALCRGVKVTGLWSVSVFAFSSSAVGVCGLGFCVIGIRWVALENTAKRTMKRIG